MASKIGCVCRAFHKIHDRVRDGIFLSYRIGSTTTLDLCGNSIRLTLCRGIAIAKPLDACVGIHEVRSREH